MMSSEIKKVIYVAMGLFMAAIILTLISIAMQLRTDITSTQKSIIASNKELSAYNKYMKYQDSVMYGDDIIAAIREFAGTDIMIYVDELQLNQIEPENPFYNNKNYENDKNDKNDKVKPFFMDYNYDENSSEVLIETLQDSVKRDCIYHSYLVYDKYTEGEFGSFNFENSKNSEDFLSVTGIKFKFVPVD